MKKKAFTLAEVLIALVIIGVIAAITVPVTMANVRRTEIETRLEQTYSIMNNALTRAVATHGPIDTWDEMKMTNASQGADFFDKYLGPYLNFGKEKKRYKLEDFGYKDIKTASGDSVYSDPAGEHTMVALNNGVCISGFGSWMFTMKDNSKRYYAVSYLVDVNGPKGPNIAGRDAFYFKLILISDDKRFNLAGATKEKIYFADERTEIIKTSRQEMIDNCATDGEYCGALIQQNGWKVPKDYPLHI